jgi:uncharacterized protein YciI
MEKRFVFFYFMKQEPAKIQAMVPMHVAYWKDLALKGYMGGPFTDHSGGMVSFMAENIEEAQEMADDDPFVQEDLLETKWLKEWKVE